MTTLPRAVLASIIMDSKDSLPKAQELGITTSLFEDPDHKKIMECITELHFKFDQYPDEVLILDELIRGQYWTNEMKTEWDSITSIDAPPPYRVDFWFNRFIASAKDRLEKESYRMLSLIKPGTSKEDEENAKKAAKELLDQANELGVNAVATVDKMFQRIKADLDQMKDGQDPKLYFDMSYISGWHDIFGRVKRNHLVVVAARPSVGKSSFLNFGVLENILAGRKGAYFNLEMEDDLIEQLVCMNSKIDSMLIDKDVATRVKYRAELEKLEPVIKDRLTIFNSEYDNIKKMDAALEAACNKKGGFDFIAVDYLQLIGGGSSKENRTAQLAEITRTIKKWTVKYGCPVIAISQLNRANETEGRPPRASDLRESGSIEQDADIVILLHRPARNSNEEEQIGLHCQEVVAMVPKFRRGRTGNLPLGFKTSTTTFYRLQQN